MDGKVSDEFTVTGRICGVGAVRFCCWACSLAVLVEDENKRRHYHN
jgi:hypothetical protein